MTKFLLNNTITYRVATVDDALALRDKLQNIVYPQTHAKAVAMDNTETLDDLNQKLLRAEDYVDTEDVYILPVNFLSKYSTTISINNCLNYKNNFIQMELNDGNIIDGDDDNVESLTDNADGNDVGMDNPAARE